MSEDASTIQAAEAKPSVSPSASSQPVMSPETAVPDTSNQETPRVTAPNATLTPIPFQADKGHKLDQAATTKTASENVPASLHALARFEFEPGKGNEGTKILMVEWEDTDTRRLHVHGGSWSVEWEGKRAVMTGTSSAKDDVKDNAEPQTNDDTRRFYFMLPPGATIPPVITLKYTPPPATSLQAQGTTFSAIKVGSHHPEAAQVTVNPLPAIYPPSLGVTARSAGKKGVLHTLWAKKRLRSLAKEIQEEEQYNLEGIALEMARTERAWILENFGVTEARVENREVREQMVDYPTTPLPSLKNPGSPTSPRLTEKLRGLKLGTSDKVLAGGKDGFSHVRLSHDNPLSPETPDVAVSSFSSFRNTPISASQTPSSTTLPNAPSLLPPRREYTSAASQNVNVIGIAPLSNIVRAQRDSSSLSAAAISPTTYHQHQSLTPIPSAPWMTGGAENGKTATATPDGLFAVALSPRSAEDERGAFSPIATSTRESVSLGGE